MVTHHREALTKKEIARKRLSKSKAARILPQQHEWDPRKWTKGFDTCERIRHRDCQFRSGLHWEIDQVALPAALLFSLGVGLSLPIYACAECKLSWIRIGGRNEPCPKCKSQHIKGPCTFLRLLAGRKRLAAEILLAVTLLFFGGIRLLPLPVFLTYILIAIFAPDMKRNRWLNCTAILFLVLLLMPIDVEVGGFHGPHFGVIKKGPRLVRLVKGMPMIDRCIKRYGEFIAGGCVVFGNEPEWLLVWDEAGLTSHKATSSRVSN